MGVSVPCRKRALRVSLALALLTMTVLVTPVAAPACDPPLAPFNLQAVGHDGGEITSIAYTGDALLTVQGSALVSYDCSTSVPVRAGTALSGQPGGTLSLDGTRAYVVYRNSFAIYDITNPLQPRLRGAYELPMEFDITGFFAHGDYAYVGYEDSGSYAAKVINVSDPLAPWIAAWSSIQIADYEPVVIGSLAYTVAPNGTLRVIDLTTPTSPVTVSTKTPTYPATSVCAVGGYAYAGTSNGTVGTTVTYGISSPASPVFIETNGADPVLDVDLAATNLWLTTGSAVERWTPGPAASGASAAILDHIDLTDVTQIEAADASTAYALVDDDKGGTIVRIATAPVTSTSIIATGSTGDSSVFLLGTIAYVTSPTGLRLLDISVPASPTVIGTAATPAAATDVRVVGEKAYVACQDGLRVFDVTDPTSPSLLGTLPSARSPKRIALANDTAYLLSDHHVGKVDVSNPAAPALTGEWYSSILLWDIDASGPRAWVTIGPADSTDCSLIELDCSAAAPAKSAEHYLPGAAPSIGVSGDVAYVGLNSGWGGTSAVKFFDVSTPGELSYFFWLDQYEDSALDVFAAQNRLDTVGRSAVQRWDTQAPSAPYLIGFAPLEARRVHAQGDLIATSDPVGGTTFVMNHEVSVRTFGGDRYATAVALSADFASADCVVLATGKSFPDALAGGPLAYALDAPVLLTDPNYVPGSVLREIERLGADRVIILGGEAAVTPAVVSQLTRSGIASSRITRLSGRTRYDTARAVARRLQTELGGGRLDTAFIATGLDFPDALAASGVAARMGAPILLVQRDDATPATRAAIDELDVRDVVVLGGTAVVSNTVARSLPSPQRVAGTNRYYTARAVAEFALGDASAHLDCDDVFVATGSNYPDALSSGVIAARKAAPTVLVEADELPRPSKTFLGDHAHELEVVNVVGGSSAVSSAVERWLAAYAD